MRFLVDMNLPPALVPFLRARGHDAEHLSKLDMERTPDRVIWREAEADDWCIISKDEDFVFLATAKHDGPKLIWVRTGNATRHALLTRFSQIWLNVMAELEQGARIVEIK